MKLGTRQAGPNDSLHRTPASPLSSVRRGIRPAPLEAFNLVRPIEGGDNEMSAVIIMHDATVLDMFGYDLRGDGLVPNKREQGMAMRFSDRTRPEDPLGKGTQALPVSRWRQAARKALDSWEAPNEVGVGTALESTYRDGIAFALKFLEAEKQPDLAQRLRDSVNES